MIMKNALSPTTLFAEIKAVLVLYIGGGQIEHQSNEIYN